MVKTAKVLGAAGLLAAALAGTLISGAAGAVEGGAMETAPWSASWIWTAAGAAPAYNETIEARKSFTLPELDAASLRITADTTYRLYVNGQWAGDGPGRSWPKHYQYDVLDILPLLRAGENEIRVVAKFFGIGTFHQLPQEPGLLAQLDARAKDGAAVTVASDATWEVRPAAGWTQYAPKQSVQMGLYEIYDARRAGTGDFVPATVHHAATEGPWQDLQPRDCPPLTRIPVTPSLLKSGVVAKFDGMSFVFPTVVWIYDQPVPSNNHVQVSGAFATVLDLAEAGTVRFGADGNAVYVDGKRAKDDTFPLEKGRHFAVVILTEGFGHWRHDTELALYPSAPLTLRNPLDDAADAPWCFTPFPETKLVMSDMEWSLLGNEKRGEIEARIDGVVRDHQKNSASEEGWKARLAPSARKVAANETTEAVHRLFQERKPVEGAAPRLEGADAYAAGTGPLTVPPAAEGDVELVFDLGAQNVGYFELDLEAEAGLEVDIAGVEYIAPDGRVQHTERYRNSMRHVCAEGRNVFTSLSRRAGRFLFVTLRKQTQPAALHAFRMVESTYPVRPVEPFTCSDPRLGQIYDISARTLKLCMEDTFTDCPLYEQTLWVGDARNEALFAFTTFGAEDLARRCIKLAAYSLDDYPMVQCQVPSTWGILLPAWSFQWVLMVWDHYLETADRDFLAWAYPYVVKNLRGADQYNDDRGLFSAPFWNMFDWSGIDDGHRTVTHNAMFAAGAADAAVKCAQILGDTEHLAWLTAYRDRQAAGVEGLWDAGRGWYADAVRGDGTLSQKTCMHTGFLSLLFDLCPKERRGEILEKLLNPPEGMTPIGSPFAMMYFLDALEKEGRGEEIVQAIYRDYQPMLDEGATTVWETFARGTTGRDGFPTRSHTHAWSSAPVRFLPRVVLGVTPEAPGGTAFRVSPRLCGLEWAKGALATPGGPVSVSWKRAGDRVDITASAPRGVMLHFKRNASLEGLDVHLNGIPQR